MSEHCNGGTSAVFCARKHPAPVVAHNGRVNDLVQARKRRVQLWELGCLSTSARENCRTCQTAQQGHRPPCSATGDAFGPTNSLDHGKLPLRHDGEVNLLVLHNREIDHRIHAHWGISVVTRTMGNGLCVANGMSTTCKTPLHCITVLLVHADENVEHLGREDKQGTQREMYRHQ